MSHDIGWIARNCPPRRRRAGRDWKREWINELRDPRFERVVNMYLDWVWEDPPAGAGMFGGFRRRKRARVRIRLAQALMADLNITPTIHVARKVMLSAFGEAADSNALEAYFADSTRTPVKKDRMMGVARSKMLARPALAAHYGNLYAWYCDRLAREIEHIRWRRWMKYHWRDYKQDRK